MSKVLIWLTSGERAKLEPGILWGVNATESVGIEKDLQEKGANLIDVGEPIAEAIKEGFQVITF